MNQLTESPFILYAKRTWLLPKILLWIVFFLYISYRYGYDILFLSGPLFCAVVPMCNSLICYVLAVRILQKAKTNTKFLWWFLVLYAVGTILGAIILDVCTEFALLHLDFGTYSKVYKTFFYHAGDNVYERIMLNFRRLRGLGDVTIWIPVVFKVAYDGIMNIQKLKKIEKQNLDFEIGVLKSQINPQFINGVLENIKKMAITQPDRAAQMVLKLSNATRYTLYETDTDYVPLQKELDFVINCIDLEETRLETLLANRANVNFRLKTNQSESLQIAPMLLFPLIERAFKCIKSNCEIDLMVENTVLTLKIEADKVANCQSETIESIKKRLDYVYPNKYKLQVIDNERILRVELQIEL